MRRLGDFNRADAMSGLVRVDVLDVLGVVRGDGGGGDLRLHRGGRLGLDGHVHDLLVSHVVILVFEVLRVGVNRIGTIRFLVLFLVGGLLVLVRVHRRVVRLCVEDVGLLLLGGVRGVFD